MPAREATKPPGHPRHTGNQPHFPHRIFVDTVRSRTARIEDEWFALLDEMGREQAFASRNRPAGLSETEELTAWLGLSALRALPVFSRVWAQKCK